MKTTYLKPGKRKELSQNLIIERKYVVFNLFSYGLKYIYQVSFIFYQFIQSNLRYSFSCSYYCSLVSCLSRLNQRERMKPITEVVVVVVLPDPTVGCGLVETQVVSCIYIT